MAILLLGRYIKTDTRNLIAEAADSAGMILLITGAGGAFGYIISQSGIGDYLVRTMTGLSVPVLVVCFLLAAILRGAQGSSTVALITTSTIMGPLINQYSVSPILAGLAICTGGLCLSLPNDSGFWVVSKFSGMSVQQTLKSWTLGNSIAGVTGLIIILIINSL
jgi:GntP family gluconate:H+ symporter